ncbi:MAG: hypothetical protein ABI305_11310 [Tepidiformaceae bacterium]
MMGRPGDQKRVWKAAKPEERETTTIVDTIAVVTVLIAAVALIATLAPFGIG